MSSSRYNMNLESFCVIVFIVQCDIVVGLSIIDALLVQYVSQIGHFPMIFFWLMFIKFLHKKYDFNLYKGFFIEKRSKFAKFNGFFFQNHHIFIISFR